jgi:hypothetical protein
MSKLTGFTKGKWSQSHREQSDGMYITQVYDESGQSICDLNWHSVGLGCSGFKTDRKQNAQLIAVAPEMYKMLDDLAKGRGVDYPIEQLLAKARGES